MLFTFKCFAQVGTMSTQQIDSICKTLDQQHKLDSLAAFVNTVSKYFYKKKNYPQAIKYAKIEANQGFKLLDSITYKKSLFNLGLYYSRNLQYYSAIETHKKIIDSFPMDYISRLTFCELGRSYASLGDYYQSVLFFEKGLEKPELLSINNLLVNYTFLIDIYDTYDTDIPKFLEKKYDLLQKVDSIIGAKKVHDYFIINHYLNFGNYYSNEEVYDFKSAKYYLNKSLEKALAAKNTQSQILALNNLAYLYNIAENDSSFLYAKKGISIAKPGNAILPKLYTNLASYYSRHHKIDLAINASHKEILYTLPVAIDTADTNLPSINTINLSFNKTQTLFALKNKAHYLLQKHEDTEAIEAVESAHKHLMIVDQLLDIIRNESIAVKSKLFWQKEASEIYMLGIKASYILNHHESAFYFMEKKKALLLLENITEQELRKSINIPPEILEEELALKQLIADAENKINDSNTLDTDSLNSASKDAKIKYSSFILSLKDKYSDYYDIKKPLSIISLKAVKDSLLDENSIAVAYALGKAYGYILMISNKKSTMHKIENVDQLLAYIKDYQAIISKPFVDASTETTFNALSQKLSSILLPNLNRDKSKLLIIPDYVLQIIPFESLKLSNGDNYLINNYETSYAYSLTHLRQNQNVARHSKTMISAFAPYTFEHSMSLNSLKKTKQELDAIQAIFNGQFYGDSLSTKANFILQLPKSKIIHLATHARANDTLTPWIAFKKEKLYLNELYSLKNNAELITLSACNTSVGEIKEGEGTFSLARGFFYSGANSVVSTLWNVNDEASSTVMQSFYKNIKAGQTKSKSLHNAKLEYLKSHKLSEASPYFWASFILIGDTDAIDLQNNYHLWYWILGFLIILILLFFFRKHSTDH